MNLFVTLNKFLNLGKMPYKLLGLASITLLISLEAIQ